MKKQLVHLTTAAIIAAMYVVLTWVAYPIAYTGAQFRVSEALTVLPFLYPPAAWGLFAGCAIANIGSPLGLIDVVCGSLATLSAALVTSRVKSRWLAPLPSVLINAVAIGAVVTLAAGGASIWVFAVAAAQIALGQLLACYGLGMPLLIALQRLKIFDRLKLRHD